MSADFGKLVYYAVEEQVKKQVGDRKFTNKQWRIVMDQVMEQFAQSLVNIVSSVVGAQQQAKAEAEAKAKAEAVAETPAVSAVQPQDAPAVQVVTPSEQVVIAEQA